MNYCANCGAVTAGKKFCGECGTALSPTTTTTQSRPDAVHKRANRSLGPLAIVVGIIFIIILIFGIIDSEESERKSARFNALSPQEKQAQTIASCKELQKGWAFKTYSELTQEERRLQFSCEVYLAK